MQENDEKKFREMIRLAMEITREAADLHKESEDFSYAMQLLGSKQVRLELRISFNPDPCITGELIRDADGELVGKLFQQQARYATVN